MAADIFKLLSRSTKLSNSTRPSNFAPQKYPSGGEPAHPQIFGHVAKGSTITMASGGESPAKDNRKRKRGQAVPIEEQLPAELDFFGESGAKEADNSWKEVAISKQKRANGDVESNSSGNRRVVHEEELPPDMDEDERRRILREHKVKITILRDSTTSPRIESIGKAGKKRRKDHEEDEQTKTTKKAKVQLYPQPLMSFRELRPRYGISRRLAENIEEQGYSVPTEVQMAALPLLLEGDGETMLDMLSVAPTGSGKTLAFLIPVMHGIMHYRKRPTGPEVNGKDADGPLAIIVAPTKELAGQILNEGRKLAKGTGIKIALMKKDMEVIDRSSDLRDAHDESSNHPDGSDEEDVLNDDHDGLKRNRPSRRGTLVKAHILVSTPFVLVNAVVAEDGSFQNLPTVQYLVLDEADVLLDPLFREQTQRIWSACNFRHLQVSLWSATMGSNIEDLTRQNISSRPDSAISPPLLRLVVGLRDTALPTINHKLIYSANEVGKLMALRQLLHPKTPSKSTDSLIAGDSLRPPFLVFTQTISRALALFGQLQYEITSPAAVGSHSRIACLHADMSDTKRAEAMTAFRRGEIWVLITTDLLARGVDFRGVNGVVNYDIPTSAVAYIHRVGRTGRGGREGGVAVTLYTEEDLPFLRPIANVVAMSEKARGSGSAKNGIAGRGVQQWLLDALPTPSKRDKKLLKKRGVEVRRPGVENTREGTKARISTKSAYERRLERRRADAVEASKRKKRAKVMEENGSDFEGFGD